MSVEKVCTKTLIPRLIHLVKDNETVKYLRKIDDKLVIEDYFQDDGKRYQPKPDLPIEYVSKDVVDIIPQQSTLDARGVLNKTIEFIRRYLELPYDQHYLILALWIFHTYLIEKFNVTPILYFFGTMATGKTRAGEVLGKLAFRCERMTSPSESYLFRSAQYFKNALVIDEIKLWGPDGNKDVADLIKSRYKRGMSVPRINLNKAEENQIEYFDVFAPLVICTTETMPPIIESRCISFVMQQNVNKDVEGDISDSDALMIREMLTVFRFFYFDEELPDVEGITRRRLNEITRPLLQICEIVDPDRKDELIDFIKWLELQRADEEGESHEAQIVKCLVEESDLVQGRKFAITAVVNAMNRGIEEKLQYGSNYISSCLKRLGFEKTRLTGGARGFKYDESLMEKLVKKYRIGVTDSDD